MLGLGSISTITHCFKVYVQVYGLSDDWPADDGHQPVLLHCLQVYREWYQQWRWVFWLLCKNLSIFKYLYIFLSPQQVRSLCTVWWACPVRRPACWRTSWSPARWPPPRRSAPSECIGTFARTRASSSSWPIWTMSWSVTGCTIDSSVANASGRNNADYINLNVWG